MGRGFHDVSVFWGKKVVRSMEKTRKWAMGVGVNCFPQRNGRDKTKHEDVDILICLITFLFKEHGFSHMCVLLSSYGRIVPVFGACTHTS